MRTFWAAALGFAMIACGFLAGAPYSPAPAAKKKAKAKKRSTRPPVPAVSPAIRAAAALKIDDYLDATAATPIRQPAALVPFFEQLLRLNSNVAPGEQKMPVHIIHWGDSHTAADEWTGGLRDQFKERFGDGGSGFSLAGHPFPGYRRFDARGAASTGWTTEGGRAGNGDGYFGLGGISVFTDRPGQSVSVNVECERLEIHYLQQPGGGRLALYDDDQYLDEIATDGELNAGFTRYTASPGPHHFVLKTLDHRPVRLFGWVADRAAGVTYEALGLNGAEASVILKWNEAMLATYLQRRGPALIVLSYGTNEASDPNWHHESYRDMFARLIVRLRNASPTSSILVVGPADRWSVSRGRWSLVAGIDGIIADQQVVCKQLGCAYWDTRERMGGPGAMRDWLNAGLSQGDRVHFNTPGYRRLASVLFSDLMQNFAAYRKARLEPTDQLAHDRAR